MFPGDPERLTNCVSWQTAFIHHNFLVIGYFAWSGFLEHGWGLLSCAVEPPASEIDRRWQRWHFTAEFIPGNDLVDRLPLEISASTIAQYCPQQELMLMMCNRPAFAPVDQDQSVQVLWLQNLALKPPVCHRQVMQRWAEFMPDDHFASKMGNSDW